MSTPKFTHPGTVSRNKQSVAFLVEYRSSIFPQALHDDITVIVIYLDHASGSSSGRFKDKNRVHCTSVPEDIAVHADKSTDRSRIIP